MSKKHKKPVVGSREPAEELKGFDYFVGRRGKDLYLVEGYFNHNKEIVFVSEGEHLLHEDIDVLEDALLDFHWRWKAISDTLAGDRKMLDLDTFHSLELPEKPSQHDRK